MIHRIELKYVVAPGSTDPETFTYTLAGQRHEIVFSQRPENGLSLQLLAVNIGFGHYFVPILQMENLQLFCKNL